MTDNNLKQANRSLTRQLWVFAFGFLLFGFALVPLYKVLCDVTGYGDRTQLAKASDFAASEPTDRVVTVEFISAAPTFGEWEFRPVVGDLKAHPGQLYEATFYVKNLRALPVTAQAIPSIAPLLATQYFHKTECFCFTPQAFDANQVRELTVRFIIDPKLPTNLDRVTLAYSMYDSTIAAPTVKVAALVTPGA